jgi:H+/Cl- antiporter ClcA
MAPPPVKKSSEEEDAALHVFKARAGRGRFDSNGSTRNAFYANPMPEPYARRRRGSAKNQLASADIDAMDFSSVVNMAIEQEGGTDQLSDLVGARPSLKDDSQTRSTGDVMKTTEGKKMHRQKRASASATIPEGANLLMKSKSSKSSTDNGSGGQRKYGTLRADTTKEKTSTAPVGKNKKKFLSPVQDTSFDLSADASDSDRFFDDNEDLSRPSSPGISAFGQVQKLKNQDSLRYSDHSFELSPDSELRRSSIIGSDFLLTGRGGKNSQSSGTIGSRAKSSQKKKGRDDEISEFSKMVQMQSYDIPPAIKPLTEKPPMAPDSSDRKTEEPTVIPTTDDEDLSFFFRVRRFLDPTLFLISDIKYVETEEGDAMMPIFPEDDGAISMRILLRRFLYNPLIPEFSSVQQFVWSIIIGIAMGIFTAGWKNLIEVCVGFFWETVPTFLKDIGVFTDLDGWFPLVHYMWICPTIFASILSYIFAVVPNKIPGQNEWITAVHSKGVQDAGTFGQLFVLSTMGMASGLSLGPELPLILTAGMAGSYLAILTKQTVLQARILNLVAASSAIGGFFGFPMAGALFVLEVPHREGLQYFEALSPAIFGSIVAVLCNRMIVNNDVTGYYKYPFLTDTLPSSIFWHAVIFGLYGAFVGIGYAKIVLKLKGWVHDIFHGHGDEHESSRADKAEKEALPETPSTIYTSVDEESGLHQESTPLVGKTSQSASQSDQGVLEGLGDLTKRLLSFNIAYEPRRAAVSGAVAGFLVGVTGMFLPHSMFWGEAQLQNLIDKGTTPLPIFGRGDDPTADLTAWAFCIIDAEDGGFSLPCSFAISLSKIFVTGLSLGTGIIGGHFWGPLFTGCIASHFLTDFADAVGHYFGVEPFIGTYPCVAILCTMGATHVVTFRAHTAIMLILTLTITAFNPLDSTVGFVAGDYSAVFPLLVVAVYVSLMVSRDQVKFYGAQRNRGDIMALPEVLCEPGKFGTPMAYDVRDGSDNDGDYGSIGSQEHEGQFESFPDYAPPHEMEFVLDPTVDEIEKNFNQMSSRLGNKDPAPAAAAFVPLHLEPPAPDVFSRTTLDTPFEGGLSSAGLDALLSMPIEKGPSKSELRAHRRTRSAAAIIERDSMRPKSAPNPRTGHRRTRTMMTARQHSGDGSSDAAYLASTDDRLVRVSSYGLVSDFQPSLVEQARARASSLHRRLPSINKRHSRKNSVDLSVASLGGGSVGANGGVVVDEANLIPPEKPVWG